MPPPLHDKKGEKFKANSRVISCTGREFRNTLERQPCAGGAPDATDTRLCPHRATSAPDSGLEETPQGSTCSKTALALLRGAIPIIYTMQK